VTTVEEVEWNDHRGSSSMTKDEIKTIDFNIKNIYILNEGLLTS
jgi:hypothetical protein